MKIIKRDGRIVPFEKGKIIDAVCAAFQEVDGSISDYAILKANNIADYVLEKAKEHKRQVYSHWEEIPEGDRFPLNRDDMYFTVEDVQDLVEKGLMATKRKDVAKAYILYRNERNQKRGNLTDKTVLELLAGTNEYWKRENSNKDADTVTVQRDYMAGIVSTDISRRFLLDEDVREAHDEGIIHMHDLDYLAQNALTNCCLINLEDMLMNGTVINGIRIDPQHRLLTATTVSTQIITAIASSQYGGCTISLTHLAPFVRMSYDFYVNDVTNELKELGIEDKEMVEKFAMKRLKKEVRDAVQTFNYQINSMSTTNGQAPFVSVCMYLNETDEYKKELAMLIEEFLEQRKQGMKNEVGVYITQAFPKLLYVLEEDNIYPQSKYYYLTWKAAECTAKRMVPDYISEKKMKELKINPSTNQGEAYPCMGCRSFLTPDRTTKNWARALNYDETKGKYYGRFNAGVTTINLPDIAFSSEGNFDTFWKLFEERTELCHRGLKTRIKRLEGITSDVAPILWQNGAFARLDRHESITELLHHGYATISLGYAGLYECVKYMTGHSHTDGGEGEKFGLQVMQALNDKCAQWKAAEDIDYSLYGSPIESTTYKFAKCLKKRFGDDIFVKLDGKDRNYITNSYHVPVFEKIDAFSKLAIESKFQKLSPGGAISYIETPNLQNNIEAVYEVIKFIYNNIMYAELNTKSDYCQNCGYDGEMQLTPDMEWYCPQCGCKDHTKLNIARRTCGYIGTNQWNFGRTQEIADRVVHLDE